MEGGLPGCSCSICEEDAADDGVRVRYWDHNLNETEPPRQPRTAEKLGLTGDGK